jgi:hypothetical protein
VTGKGKNDDERNSGWNNIIIFCFIGFSSHE